MVVWKTAKIRNRDYKINPGMYEVSSDGDIRNKNTMKILKPSSDSRGYCIYKLSCIDDNGKIVGKSIAGHRIVMDTFKLFKYPNKYMVNHINGNKRKNNLKNLEYCDNSYNQKHAYKNGLRVKKSNYGIDIIEIICKLIEQGVSTKEIKKQIGCPKGEKYRVRYNDLITRIRRREIWQDISENYNW